MLSQEFGYDCPRLVSTGDISLDISHFSAQQHKLDISLHLTIFHVWDDSAIAKRTQAVPRPEDWSRLPGRPRIMWLKTVLDDLQLHNLTLSVLMVVFPGGPGLAGTRIYPFWILLELRMKEVAVTTGATRSEKRQSNCHHQQTITNFFQVG